MDSAHYATRRRGRGAPPAGERLSREVVVSAAAELISKDGLEAFSVRRLAHLLGVAPNGLYNHIRDRAELLDAVTETFARQIAFPPVVAPWPAWVRSVAVALREQMLEHPGRAELLLGRAGATPAGPVAITAFLDASGSLGVDRATAHLAWHAIVIIVAGSDWHDRSRGEDRDDAFGAVLDLAVGGLTSIAEAGAPASAVRLLDAHGLAE